MIRDGAKALRSEHEIVANLQANCYSTSEAPKTTSFHQIHDNEAFTSNESELKTLLITLQGLSRMKSPS
jgi:hypothetical protein